MYSNAFGWAIAESILENRTKYLTDVILAKAAQDANRYTMDQALADIQIYHERGSFYNGMIEINKRIASGDRRGVMPSATPQPKLELPDSVAAAKNSTTNKIEAALDVKFTTVNNRAFKITISSVDGASLANLKDPLVSAVTPDPKKPKQFRFEVLLSGSTSFKIEPQLKDATDANQGFRAIIIDVDDDKGSRYVVEVTK